MRQFDEWIHTYSEHCLQDILYNKKLFLYTVPPTSNWNLFVLLLCRTWYHIHNLTPLLNHHFILRQQLIWVSDEKVGVLWALWCQFDHLNMKSRYLILIMKLHITKKRNNLISIKKQSIYTNQHHLKSILRDVFILWILIYISISRFTCSMTGWISEFIYETTLQ